MRWIIFGLVCTLSLTISGISGCDGRAKFSLFEYELTECPATNFSLPTQTTFEKWELKIKEPPRSCSTFNYYLMADEKFRSGGGFGKVESPEFYANISRGKSCSLIVAYAFDSTDPNPKERFRKYAEIAATALLKSSSVKTKFPEKKFEVIGKPDEFKKWCSAPVN